MRIDIRSAVQELANDLHVTSLAGHKKGRAAIRGGRVHAGARLYQDLHHVQVAALGGEEKGRGAR